MKRNKLTALLLLIAALTSCGGNAVDEVTAPPAPESTETTAPETDYAETLTANRYDGMTLNLLGTYHASRQTFAEESENGEPVNDALFRRDREIEELFGITVRTNLSDSIDSDATKSAMSGDDEYQLVLGTMGGVQKNLALKRLSSNLHDFPYIALDKPWWCAQADENLTVNGKLFFTTGPITPQFYFAAQAMAYNTRLADEYSIKKLDSLALEGKWTLDKLEELLKDKGKDLNGDGKMNGDDSFGMVFESSVGANAFYVGAGEKYCEVGNDGITVSIADERSVGLIERLSKLLTDPENVYDTHLAPEDINHFVKMFTDGRSLFATTSMSHVIVSFREMTDDYVLLPMPKLDESQEDYHTYSNQWCLGGVSIPVTVKEREAVGNILETMAYLSWKYVRPAQYEITLKGKVARESESQSKLLDIIFDSSYYDLNGIFNFGKSADLVGKAITGQTNTLASDYESIKNSVKNDIDSLMENFE